METLTELEKLFVLEFVNNVQMFSAVQKAFQAAILESDIANPRLTDYAHKILPAKSNEDVGADIRARIAGIDTALQVGFSTLLSYKNSPQQPIINKAR